MFRNTVENFVGTNPYDACSGPGQDAWPPDVNGDAWVNIIDALLYGDHTGFSEGDAGYTRRMDLNADRVLNIMDILLLGGFSGMTCTP